MNNGHSNGHANGRHKGNGISISKRESGEHNRKEVQDTCRSVLSGWLLDACDPIAEMAAAIKALREVVENPLTRPATKAIAGKALSEALQQSVALALRLSEMEDKQERLDTPGAATERVVYDVRMPEARERMGLDD
jgi:hypothetical protein